MNKENKAKPRFTIRPSRRGPHRTIRHHNPGTRRRPPTPRVRVLSSITVVPPNNPNIPKGGGPEPIPCLPSTSYADQPLSERFEPPLQTSYEEPWRTPESIGIPPTNSPWRQARSLVPKPTVEYGEEFQIIPGEAYQPVPIYINRDQPWRLRPIDMPVQRRVRRYRSDINDPRLHNLRVEVTPLMPEPEPPKSRASSSPERLFASPRRPLSPPTPSSNVLTELIDLLDRTYGCPRPASSKPPVASRSTPSTTLPTEKPSPSQYPNVSDSLAALVRLAKLFGGIPPDEVPSARRKFKRPHCRQRE